jgi:hypothetical protein
MSEADVEAGRRELLRIYSPGFLTMRETGGNSFREPPNAGMRSSTVGDDAGAIGLCRENLLEAGPIIITSSDVPVGKFSIRFEQKSSLRGLPAQEGPGMQRRGLSQG